MTNAKWPPATSKRRSGALAMLSLLILCYSEPSLCLLISPPPLAAPNNLADPGLAQVPLPPMDEFVVARGPVTGNFSRPPSSSPLDFPSPSDQAFPDQIATPGTLLLFASGLFGLAVWRRRKASDKPRPWPKA